MCKARKEVAQRFRNVSKHVRMCSKCDARGRQGMNVFTLAQGILGTKNFGTQTFGRLWLRRQQRSDTLRRQLRIECGTDARAAPRIFTVSYTLLLWDPVRLDAVCCFLWRNCFATQRNTHFIWIDALSQHCEELLSTAVDVVVDGVIFRRI